MVRAGADIIAIDGVRGATGAAPKVIRDNVGIPIELALAQIDQRLREEGIRNQAGVVAAGGFRSAADVVKAIALGADAVYIGTAALIAMGCTVCQRCYTGKCPWGIATSDPWISKRINPDIASKRLVNLLHSWSIEIKDMMGGMGINAIESLRGNRLALRGVGLSEDRAEDTWALKWQENKEMQTQNTNPKKSTQNTNHANHSEGKVVKVDAEGLYYRELNCLLRQLIRADGIERMELHNVCGQRYIGTDLATPISKSTSTAHPATT